MSLAPRRRLRARLPALPGLLVGVLLAAGVGIGAQPAGPAAAATIPSTVVSLTYDDGTADQVQAGSLMAKYGMHGTFYINSGRLNSSGYMSTADAQSLQSAGNEIGGHTVSHADLPTLSTDEATRQVCNDRVNLLGMGFDVRNFAYPYGDESPSVEQVVAGCGYNSARGIGDIVSPGTCSGCAYAEHIPPVNPWALDTPDSIKAGNTLEDMENYVLQAEQHGGGWVIMTMHHICSGCDPYSVPAVQLDSFLSWLSKRAANGTTVARVNDAIGGPQQPGVPGPTPPPPLTTSNLLQNPGMETLNSSTGIPVCWQRGGYGTNSYSWSVTPDAHSGVRAQRVDVSSYTDGDRKMISPQDLGACAPPTVVGHTYQAHGWYKSNGNVRLIAYSRSTLGGWTFLGQGPVLGTSPTGYAEATWTTPAMPPGSTAISVGFSLRSTGFVQGDDMSLNDTDQTAPTAAITSPADGSRVRGTVTFAADASDGSGVRKVDFLVDGTVVCTAAVAPWSCPYDTTTKPDSVIAVTARATDTAGNVGLSAGENYTVSNSIPLDTTPPSVSVTGPSAGSNVNGSVTLTAAAADNDAVNEVMFYVDGVQVGATGTAPYTMAWDSSTVPDGDVTVVAKALDLSGNLTTAAPISVTVDNAAVDSVSPTSSAQCDGTTCSIGWYRTAPAVTLSATDVGTGVDRIVYTTDGSTPTASHGAVYSGAFSVSQVTTLEYRAFDVAGNAEPINTLTLQVDTVAPIAAVGSPANGATVTGTTYIVSSVSDNVGVVRVWFYLDGKALGSRVVAPLQWKWDTTTVARGQHALYVVAYDAAGNTTKSATISVTVA